MKDVLAKEVAAKECPLGALAKGYEMKSDSELNKAIDKTVLSKDEKAALQKETGWSDKITDSVKTKEEAEVYKNAGLKDANGNLERPDIDWSARIPQDRIDRIRKLYGDEVADKWSKYTNADLIKEGKAPYGNDGKPVSLHHIGQKADSPLAELTDTEHKSNDGILHDKRKPTEIDRVVFRDERKEYWMNRYNNLNKS